MSTQPKDSPPQFPPLEWMGYGLDLTGLDPFDFASVGAKVVSAKTQTRIVDITKDTRMQTVTIDGVEYKIPRVVQASEDTEGLGLTKTFSDGALAVNALQNDSSLAYRLLSVTTENNSLFPLDKSLPTKDQFYFFVNDHARYSGRLRDYLDFINEKQLLKHVSKLAPFDSENPEVVQAYLAFFSTVGSHFVTATHFGASFQLQVWASNKYEEVNSNFVRDVTASVEGLNDGGEFDGSVFDEPQYQNFSRLSQRIIRIRGGDPSLADSLADSPDHSTFQQWTNSISDNVALVNFKASELWTLLRDANDKRLRSIAGELQKAFEYFSSLRKEAPNDKHTWITFETESKWGEFGILTPNAIIGGGDSDQLTLPQALPQPVSLGPAKLHWGSSSSHLQGLFVGEVINDGTPINIYVSCDCGSAKVVILGQTYESTGGIQRFSNVPVS